VCSELLAKEQQDTCTIYTNEPEEEFELAAGAAAAHEGEGGEHQTADNEAQGQAQHHLAT